MSVIDLARSALLFVIRPSNRDETLGGMVLEDSERKCAEKRALLQATNKFNLEFI